MRYDGSTVANKPVYIVALLALSTPTFHTAGILQVLSVCVPVSHHLLNTRTTSTPEQMNLSEL